LTTQTPSCPGTTLVQANDGNFYGTTQNGGNTACTLGCGTVFRITPNGKLTTFNFDGTNGSQPFAGLVQVANGDFYGVTIDGGGYSRGTVFKFTPNGGLITLYSFLVLIWFSSVHDNESGSLRRIPIPQSKAMAIVYLSDRSQHRKHSKTALADSTSSEL
jgi:uncharacterized repeat protein (TIGR03803 family)